MSTGEYIIACGRKGSGLVGGASPGPNVPSRTRDNLCFFKKQNTIIIKRPNKVKCRYIYINKEKSTGYTME